MKTFIKYHKIKSGNKCLKVLFVMAVSASTNSFAQNGLSTETDVSGTKFRQLEKASKIPETPLYRDTTFKAPDVKYSNVPAQARTVITPEQITPAKIKVQEEISKLYRSYAKLGFGNFRNILGEYYFNETRARKHDYGIHVKHFSSAGYNTINIGDNGFSTNEINMHGRYMWKDIYGKLSLDYKRDAIHYFGYDLTRLDLSTNVTKQVFNAPSFEVNLGSFHNDTGRINHKETFKYRPYIDKFGVTEHYIFTSFSGGKQYNKEYYNLDVSVDVNNYISDDQVLPGPKIPTTYNWINQQASGLIKLNPSITTLGRDIKVKIGLSIMSEMTEVAKFHFYPDLEFSYSLFNDIFIPYLGLNGEKQRNSYFTLSQENPFVFHNMELLNTNKKINAYGGFKGTLSSTVSFNTMLAYSVNTDVPLFYNDTLFSEMNRFGVLYDDINVFDIGGQLLFRTASKWHVLVSGNYYNYSTKNELYAWGKPDFKFTTGLVYDLKDKLIARLNINVLGGRKMFSLEPDSTLEFEDGKYIANLKPYVDANLGLEYRYTKRLSAFLNINNFTAARYQRWYKFPVQGFNVLGGLTYSF